MTNAQKIQKAYQDEKPVAKFSVRLPESLKRQLAEYAEKNRMTQREVIETALRALIEKPPRKKRWWRR